MRCTGCKKKVTKWTGIVCANYSNAHGQYPPCHQAWHRICYKVRTGDTFPVAKLPSLGDEDSDDELDDEEENIKYQTARNGDHYLCPFQYNLCQFRNIYGRNPGLEPYKDKIKFVLIRRAILDAFWARASSTVKKIISGS